MGEMSLRGAFRTWRDVRSSVAIGCKADIKLEPRESWLAQQGLRYPIEHPIHSPSLRSGERPSGVVRFVPTQIICRSETNRYRFATRYVRKWLSDTLRPLRRSGSGVRACNGFGYIGSEEPLGSGRDRQCGEPRLSSAYLRKVGDKTDPTICHPSTV